MKLYKFIINCICCLIPIKKLRHNIRDNLMDLYWLPASIPGLVRWFIGVIPKNAVLIVEPNYFHGETIPGNAKYMIDLGFAPTIILHPALRRDNPFCKWPAHPKVLYIMPNITRLILKSKKRCAKFEFVFFTSHTMWSNRYLGPYTEWLGYIPNTKMGYIAIEHDISFIQQHNQTKNEHRLFTLCGFGNLPMLNPHYFGEIKFKNKNKKTVFVAVINQESSMNNLFTATRDLIRGGYSNFKIIITGRTCVKTIPEDLQDIISLTGFISFKKLWQIIENADFFIFGLDPNNTLHQRYAKTTVTGSLQTVLGFAKPGIIDPYFADKYNLNNSSAIIDTNLSNAIKTAINMPLNKYKDMQNALKELANNFYKTSLKNIETKIRELKQ